MRYACGLYGGNFNPLHLGHVQCIIEAANQCRRLILVLSCGENRDEIDVRVRYRWLYTLTKHIGNVSILVLRDDATSPEEYDEDYWYADTERVQHFAGESIDAVFFGDDYGMDSFWTQCYPNADLVVIPRDGISSREIRKDPIASWDWLPAVVRPYYAKKVLIIGGEMTGKSTLTANLANYYNTNYLEEVRRDMSARAGADRLMLPEDFTDILLQHKSREIEALKHSNRVLFEDTDCLTTLFYLNLVEDNAKDKDKNALLAVTLANFNSYDLIVFLEPDIASIPVDRLRNSEQIKDIYRHSGYEFHVLSGDYHNRFLKALQLVDEALSG